MADPSALRELFDQAVGLPAADRAAFLKRACRDDDLRSEVERLLAAHEQQGSVFDTVHASEAADSRSPDSATGGMSLTPGAHLGPYVIAAPLGAGGMGEVYKARDTRLNRTVALKVLSPELTRDSTARQRFEREARAAAALAHPHICTLLDIGQQDDVDYLVMEYLDGETLATRLGRGTLPLDQALAYGIQIAEALSAAHRAGIVHRDLKPANIMLTKAGAKLLDFGLAKPRRPAVVRDSSELRSDSLTGAGTILGTLQYMAPEQLEGREADARSDVFAYGALLYEMLAGRGAFEGRSDAALIANILHSMPLDAMAADIPLAPVLNRIIRHCLEKDPDDRFQSAQDVAFALDSIGKNSSADLARAPFLPRRSRSAAWLIAVGAVALVASGVLMRLQNDTPMEADGKPPTLTAPSEPGHPLVAVQAFRSLSPDASQHYFAAGMTEEIHGRLSKLSGLRLLSRTAADRYGEGDARRMADELGVASVVEGSVRLENNMVRITVALVDASNQQTLWSEQYDRKLSDVFAVQTDVALRTAEALQVNLSPGERKQVEKRPTENLEAYQQYLQALNMPLGDRVNRLAQIQALREVIALDPEFADAQADLAHSLIFMSNFDDDPMYIAEGIARAEATVRKDPLLSDGHTTLATGYMMKGRASQARLSFLRALELDPSANMNDLSILDVYFGHFAEGLHWARQTFRLSGKRGNDYYHVSVPLLSLRDDDVTWRWLISGERRFPDEPRLQIMLALVEVLRGRDADAAGRMKRALERAPDDQELRFMRAEVAFLTDSSELESSLEPLMRTSSGVPGFFVAETPRVRWAYALAKRGDAARVGALIEEAEGWARRKTGDGSELPLWRVELAAIHTLKKDFNASLEALSRAYDAGYREYGLLERDPIFVPLRGDQRFREVLDRMRRDVDAQRQHARERGLLDLEVLTAPPK